MSAKAKVKRLVELGEFEAVIEIPPLGNSFRDSTGMHRGGGCSPDCPKGGEDLVSRCEWAVFDQVESANFPSPKCPRYGSPFGHEDE